MPPRRRSSSGGQTASQPTISSPSSSSPRLNTQASERKRRHTDEPEPTTKSAKKSSASKKRRTTTEDVEEEKDEHVEHEEEERKEEKKRPAVKYLTQPDADSDVEMVDAPPLVPPPALAKDSKTKQTTSASKRIKQEKKEEKREDSDEEMEEKSDRKRNRRSAAATSSSSPAAASAAASSTHANAAAAANNIDSDEDESDHNHRHSNDDDFYTPRQSSTPEVISPHDPFSSSSYRTTHILSHLSPLYIPTSMPGLESQSHELHDLLVRTSEGINNAALLLGARGSGKTSLLEMTLARIKKDRTSLGKSTVIIRLDGTIQTDDTLAMREIVYQICRDYEIEPINERSDFHTHLAFLVKILEQGTFHGVPIIFILNEFHYFTLHTKQTLLYNLCDLLQSRSAQICILGLTPVLDCYERLEKRIRSRLCHRRILVGGAPSTSSLLSSDSNQDSMKVMKEERQKKMQELVKILKERLYLPLPTSDATEANVKSTKKEEQKEQAKSRASSSPASTTPSAAILHHNTSIDTLFSSTSSPHLHTLLSTSLSLGRPVRWFLSVFQLAMTCLGQYHPVLTQEDVVWAVKMKEKDQMIQALKHCSVLELTLLTALTHLSHRHIDYQNFHQLYEVYTLFQKRSSVGASSLTAPPLFPESQCQQAWEELLSRQQLLVWRETPPTIQGASLSTTYTGRGVQRRFMQVKLVLDVREFQQALKDRVVEAPTWLLLWANHKSD